MERTAPTLPSLRVLVVDDDIADRKHVRSALESAGHKVVGEASDGVEMARLALAERPDLLLFDVHLPGLSGLDGLRQIRQQTNLAAAVITSDSSPDMLRQAIGEKVIAYLVKPVEPQELLITLRVAHMRYAEERALLDENTTLKQNLENRKLIERAKGTLMKRHKWTEAEAFRRLQRAAMNRRTSMVELARDILNGVEVTL